MVTISKKGCVKIILEKTTPHRIIIGEIIITKLIRRRVKGKKIENIKWKPSENINVSELNFAQEEVAASFCMNNFICIFWCDLCENAIKTRDISYKLQEQKAFNISTLSHVHSASYAHAYMFTLTRLCMTCTYHEIYGAYF